MKARGEQGKKVGTQVLPSCISCRCWLAVLLLPGLLLPIGCSDRGAEKARQEAADAKAKAAKLELSLTRAGQEISELKAELKVVRAVRDELQGQADELQRDREEASALARQAKDMITHMAARADNQAGTSAALEREIAQLKALVKDQETIIEEFHKSAAAKPRVPELAVVTTGDESPPDEPNELP